MGKLSLVLFLCFFLSGSIRLKAKKHTAGKLHRTKSSGKVNMSLTEDSSNASSVSTSLEANGASLEAKMITSHGITKRMAESSGVRPGSTIGITSQDEAQDVATTPQDSSGRKLLEPTKSLQAAIWSWKWKSLLREKNSQSLFSDLSRFFSQLDSSVKDIVVLLKKAAETSPAFKVHGDKGNRSDDWKDLRNDVNSFMKKWTDRFHKHYLEAIHNKMVEMKDPAAEEFQKMAASGKVTHGMNFENWVYSEKASKDFAQRFCLSNFDEPIRETLDMAKALAATDDSSEAKEQAKELADEIMKSFRIMWPVFIEHLEKFCDFNYEIEDGDGEEEPFARIVVAQVLEPLIKELVEWTQKGGDASLSEPLVKEVFHKIGELEKVAQSQEDRDSEENKTSDFFFDHVRLVTGDDGQLKRHPEQIRSLVEPGLEEAEEAVDGLHKVVDALVEKQTGGEKIIAEDRHSEELYQAALKLSESVVNLEDATKEFTESKLHDEVEKKLHLLIERMTNLMGKMTELFQKEHA